MHQFQEISTRFEAYLKQPGIFPEQPANLYDPCRYLLEAGGKRVRPALCLMANELFGTITEDAFKAAAAIELFHNFTLIHDDIMDKAPLRRGKPTVHAKYGLTAGILSGDVMSIFSFDCLSRVNPVFLPRVLSVYNKTAVEVCEGQQWDMDFEVQETVSIEQYLHMITLKTSVLLAASMQIGAILGGATEAQAALLYEFGKNLGIAFQLQDDYLDTFGEEAKTGKQPGGDIRANKKTFLMIKCRELAGAAATQLLGELLLRDDEEKVEQVTGLLRDLEVDAISRSMIHEFSDKAFGNLEQLDIEPAKKQPLMALAAYLLNRQN
ncbi:polyprenyl synthetase family protein [Taibaiella chishuiensis]|uniref:Geranylgeranyl diphosphate synthase type II n=1 Tax=Taibaiella chishuiensis TaxID=1434707 RepID=A0A2P8D4Q6_9BACT|nr:polyprenyl synthetase family protein [Taibaiella chishuiensis]PSK92206.1 geranylgeranyl diphosphate synthase type II [Taibaiella chishuiensis]